MEVHIGMYVYPGIVLADPNSPTINKQGSIQFWEPLIIIKSWLYIHNFPRKGQFLDTHEDDWDRYDSS
jgi:hypothetical protein